MQRAAARDKSAMTDAANQKEVEPMSHLNPDRAAGRLIRTVAEAGTYITRVCFKHGPPARTGIELEWLLLDPTDPDRYPDVETLVAALGPHAPRTLDPDSPARPLPSGGVVTVEPGGQVEISSAPAASVAELSTAMTNDIAALTALLTPSGFVLADEAADPYRRPRRILHTPRYDAMAEAFDQVGPAGRVMMCATAATQICLDLGTRDTAADRWRAAHQLGPVLLAAFANSPRSAGDDNAIASSRMSSWWRLDPPRTLPPLSYQLDAYVQRALDVPVLAINRPEGQWRVEEPLTLRQWAASSNPLTTADIDLHLSMLFPPVRPQGYLELRYLDAQPAGEWIAPLALLSALFSRTELVRRVLELTDEAATRWQQATEIGLQDDVLRRTAADIAELGWSPLSDVGLDPATLERCAVLVRRRLVDAVSPAADQLTREGNR
jgi:glutamate--cysteine ligase